MIDNTGSQANYESPRQEHDSSKNCTQLNFDTESDDEELNQVPMKSAKEMLYDETSNSDSDGEEKQLLADKTPEFQMSHEPHGGWTQKESLEEE